MDKKNIYLTPEVQEIELSGMYATLQASPDVDWKDDDDFDLFG